MAYDTAPKAPIDRKGDKDEWRRWAHHLIDELLELRFATDPADGEVSAVARESYGELKSHLGLITLATDQIGS